jgi:hypothetical protein
VEKRIVQLTDLVDAVHELRELLELRPLVVRRRHWHVDLDLLAGRLHRGAAERRSAEVPAAADQLLRRVTNLWHFERGGHRAEAGPDEKQVPELVAAPLLDTSLRLLQLHVHLDKVHPQDRIGCQAVEQSRLSSLALRPPLRCDRRCNRCERPLSRLLVLN